jgi:hypothetical protein
VDGMTSRCCGRARAADGNHTELAIVAALRCPTRLA